MSLSEQDKKTILSLHNNERRSVNSNAPALKWDPELAAGAQAWVEGPGGEFGGPHDPKIEGVIGENLAWGTSPTDTVAAGVQDWLSEKRHYQGQPVEADTGGDDNYGHYTQMIWKMTDRIGCGWVQTAKGWALCCRYLAHGNMPGKRPSDTYNTGRVS